VWAIRRADIRAEPHTFSGKVGVESDVAVGLDDSLFTESLHVPHAPIEVKTRAMSYRELSEVLPTVLEILQEAGAEVNAGTGIHVHHDVPEIVERPELAWRFASAWWRDHTIFYGLVEPSRESNPYCAPPSAEETHLFDDVESYRQLRQVLSHASRYWELRYRGLNLCNLADRERLTLEFRLGHATFDWAEVRAWILFTHRWVEHYAHHGLRCKGEPRSRTTKERDALFMTIGMKQNNRLYDWVAEPFNKARTSLIRQWRRFERMSFSVAT
jgi:hypothetical protein